MSLLAPTYGPRPMSLIKGQGSWLTDQDAKTYLDFASGIAVTSLGHNHPELTAAIQKQAGQLLHTSNLFGVPGQEEVASLLTKSSFADRVFFTNSGAEAMEACIKFARRYHWHQGHPEKFRIITFDGAFHGRTLSTIAAGGAAKYLEGFGPKVDGFDQVAYENLNEARQAVGHETAALLVEPIQGEGGIRPHSREFMQGIRAMADEFGLLLILDEVQTGVGRTGKMWAHEHAQIQPDLMASAKGLGGGFPVGAALMTQGVSDALSPGVHGTTYGGNPLAMAAAKAVLEIIDQPAFLTHVEAAGSAIGRGLSNLQQNFPELIKSHRGMGLLRGVQLTADASVPDFVRACFGAGLLVVPAGDQTVRLLPPLNVTLDEVEQALKCLHSVCLEAKT